MLTESINNTNVFESTPNTMNLLSPGKTSQMVLACSGITSEDKIKFEEFCTKYKITVKDTIDKKVTHLIVNHNEDMAIPGRTMKILKAISKRKWIIGIRWVLDSLAENMCLDPQDYEVRYVR